MRGPPLTPVEERIWVRIKKGRRHECWPCTGSYLPGGYGQINIKTSKGWRPKPLHRVVWEVIHGPIPKGLDVLHRCNNPPCCNAFSPKHLYLGTDIDNAADRALAGTARGPQVWGENHWTTKVSDADVKAIRRKYATGEWTQRELAKEFGITQACVWRYVNCSNWTPGQKRLPDTYATTPRYWAKYRDS